MLLLLCLVAAVPLLIVALIAGGGLAGLFKPRNPTRRLDEATPPIPQTGYVRKCTTCGRGLKADWDVCPSCGAALA